MILTPLPAEAIPLVVWAAQVSSPFPILDIGRTPSVIFAIPFVLRLDSTRDGVVVIANCTSETSHRVPVTPCAGMILSEFVSGIAACAAQVSKNGKKVDTRIVKTRIGPANMSNGIDRVSNFGAQMAKPAECSPWQLTVGLNHRGTKAHGENNWETESLWVLEFSDTL